MACSCVADGGHSLQVWKVAENTFNKQSWAADKGWSLAWGLGVGLTTHCKSIILLQEVTQVLGLGCIIWINDLS
jgi:hypothetical protein